LSASSIIKTIRKILLLLLLLFMLPGLIGCEFQYGEEVDYVYLDIDVENSYGVAEIEPGIGRFRYEKDSLAELKFSAASGYDFVGWQGEDGDKVSEGNEEGEYTLKLDNKMQIKAALDMLEFKPLEIDIDGVDAVSFDDRKDITDVPHNISNIQLEFNNALNDNNEIEAEIIPANNESNDENDLETIEPEEIEVQNNEIIVSLTGWRDRFFADEEEDEHLEFGQEYKLTIDEATTGDNIFDVDNREIEDEIDLSFVVKEPYPAAPEDVSIRVEDDNLIELSWHRSRENAEIDIDEYVEIYRIYKSKDRDELLETEEIDEDEVEVIEVSIGDLNVDDPQDKKVLRYEDEAVDLLEDDYFYRIKAVNDLGNESRLSELVGTE